MSSQHESQSKNTGKARDDVAAAQGSGPSMQSHPDPDICGQASPMDPPKQTTNAPQDKINKKVNRWLSNTEIASASDVPSIHNKENARLSSDIDTSGLDELTKELNALAKRPFNAKQNAGTTAPVNTPQSCERGGHRARARSTGDAPGGRIRMGPQAKTMEDNGLSKQAKMIGDGDLPLPLFSKSNSSKVAGTSNSLPEMNQSPTTYDEIQAIPTTLPNKSKDRTLSLSGPSKTAPATDGGCCTSSKTAVAHASQPCSSTRVSACSTTNNLDLAQNSLDQHQGISSIPTKLPVDSSSEQPSAGTHEMSSISPPTLPGSTVNAFGLAQPPSPFSFEQHPQTNQQLPLQRQLLQTSGSMAEPDSRSDGPQDAPQFHNFSEIGREHSPHASTVMLPARPKSRFQRILQDLRQLWRDCACGYRVTQVPASESDPCGTHEASAARVRSHQDRSRFDDIFERAAERGAEYAKSLLPSFDYRLRRESSPFPDSGPRSENPPQSNSQTLDDESSGTAQEASIHSEPPANVRPRSRNAFRSWRAMRAGTARKISKMNCGGSSE